VLVAARIDALACAGAFVLDCNGALSAHFGRTGQKLEAKPDCVLVLPAEPELGAMMIASPPPDEGSRLRLLSELEVLDTPPEAGFDALTLAARLMTGWPVALVSLIDAKRQWFKSHDGLATSETPRELAFCAHALLGGDLFEVPDTHSDPRFADNPLVTGAPGIRAYAGQPLVVQGVSLGTLCVINTVPAQLDATQRAQLRALAAVAAALLTERLNRAKLTLERERLADFGAASGDWLWEADEQHRIVWLSSAYESATGQSAATQLGHPMPDRPLLDARGLPLQPGMSLHQLCQRGRAFSRAVVSLAGIEGLRGERWLSLSAVPMRDAAGQAIGMRGSARDVSAQVLADRAREEEAQRLGKLVALAPGVLYQFRVDGAGIATVPFATESLQTLFEVSPALAAADAGPLFDRIHADDLPAVQRSLELSVSELAPWQATFRVCLPVAGERYLSAHSLPQREADGGVLWHGLVTDVTPQVLERQEREGLQRERDRAQRESRARADALSHVSHELRTPLNAILGFTQLMQAALREELGDGSRNDNAMARRPDHWPQWVEQVHRAASHLLALVNDVLDLSSMEARRLVIDLQPVDATELAQEVVEMVRPQAVLRGLRLQLSTPGDPDPEADPDSVRSADAGGLWVHADKRALRQVLINLVGNACQYTPSGGHVILRLSKAPGSFLRLQVCDDGPGMSSEQQARLFQPFERGSKADGATVGTGLGLVISRELVRAMQGQLTLESSPGKGSVFAVELPLALDASRPAAVANAADSLFGQMPDEDAGAPLAFPEALLLYVEDDPVNGLLMQEFVARMPPLRLRLALDLAQGLAAVQTLKPDLVLLDMNLPDGSGYDLLREIRADPATHGLRVVALSADAMPEQVHKAMAAGFDDYWTKPVDFRLLRRRISACLNRRSD
jgi:signal transduction histidine kinase/ActR/RegA family two-component response regulator